MAGDQPDDPFGLGRLAQEAGIDASLAQPVEPEPPVGIDHDLDHQRIGQRIGDRWPHGAAQHGAAALGRSIGLPFPHGRPPSVDLGARVLVLLAICRPT
jgi:hypothetical protein